ncbi:hypothetical protein D3C87_74480 [compost metagenome]
MRHMGRKSTCRKRSQKQDAGVLELGLPQSGHDYQDAYQLKDTDGNRPGRVKAQRLHAGHHGFFLEYFKKRGIAENIDIIGIAQPMHEGVDFFHDTTVILLLQISLLACRNNRTYKIVGY